MKKNYILIFGTIALLLISSISFAQMVLYNQNFNSGAGTFQLNTTDQSSTTTGFNTWIVNNSYTGGSATIVCMGFPFTTTIGNTPAQPAGIVSPNSGYLHILSTDAQSNSITNANYRPADGFCAFAENYFSKTPSISTSGHTSVSLSFWWLCMGSANAYGELFYSTDGGTTWTQSTSTSQYINQGTWIQETVTNPAFDNQPSIMFGFRFVNTVASGGTDPSFSIDDINVTGMPATGINSLTNASSISVYPNPASEFTTINLNGFETSNDAVTITVTNELGQIVLNRKEAYASQINLNTNNLSNGVYSIAISSGNKKAITKFVKI